MSNEKEEADPQQEDIISADIKKKYKPDWIESDNKIFINKLNSICENFDKNNSDVSKIV